MPSKRKSCDSEEMWLNSCNAPSSSMYHTPFSMGINSCRLAISVSGILIRSTTKAVCCTSVFMLVEYAAPVASIMLGLTAGEARLMRDKAPSMITSSMPTRCMSFIHRFSPLDDEGPDRRILPPVKALAVTTRPNEVFSSLTSMSSETMRFWR